MTGTKAIALIAAAGIAAGGTGYYVGRSLPAAGTAPAASGSRAVASEASTPASDFDPTAPRDLEDLGLPVAEAIEQALVSARSGDPMGALGALMEIEDEVSRKEALYELIQSLDAEGLGQLVQGMLEGSGGGGRDDRVAILFSSMGDAFALFDRWTELDIDAVSNFIAHSGGPGQADAAPLFRLISLAFVARRNPARATELAERLGEGELDIPVNSIVAFGISMSDPKAGVRAFAESRAREDDGPDFDDLFDILGSRVADVLPEVLAFPGVEQRGEALRDLFGSWGETDPRAALAAAETLSDADGRESILGEVMERYAQVDPRGAAAHVEAMPEGKERDEAMASVASNWMRSDPGAALSWARMEMDDVAVAKLVAGSESKLSPEVGLAIIGEGMTEEGRAEYFKATNWQAGDHFLWKWAAGDAVSAMAWLRETGGFDEGNGTSGKFGEFAGAQGSDTVDKLLESMPAGEYRDHFLGQAAQTAGQSDPGAALVWAQGLAGDEGASATAGVLKGWAKSDPQAAAEAALDMGAEPGGAMGQVVKQWAGTDPASAYEWLVETHAGDPDSLVSVMNDSHVVTQWAVRDPAAAADASMGLPGDLAPTSMGHTFRTWAGAEPKAASAYINERLDPGPMRDAAVSGLIERIRNDDPAAAAQWAGTITDGALRSQLLGSLQSN